MPAELAKQYAPAELESKWYEFWEKEGLFQAGPGDRSNAPGYSIVIPPPNITGRLHMGHALNNSLQDVLTRVFSRSERLIVLLYYYEHLTMKEIGATLDLSESRVSQMHTSIVKRLQVTLSQRLDDLGDEREVA